MNPFVKLRQTRRPSRISVTVALLMVMLSAQTLSVLHAEAHLFHDSDEFCVAFHNLDKQPVLPGAIAYARDQRAYRSDAQRIQPHSSNVQAHAFQARAPPYRRQHTT